MPGCLCDFREDAAKLRTHLRAVHETSEWPNEVEESETLWKDKPDFDTPHKLCLRCNGMKIMHQPFRPSVIGYLSVCESCYRTIVENMGFEAVRESALGAAQWKFFCENRGSGYYDLDPEFFGGYAAPF